MIQALLECRLCASIITLHERKYAKVGIGKRDRMAAFRRLSDDHGLLKVFAGRIVIYFIRRDPAKIRVDKGDNITFQSFSEGQALL